VVTSTSVPRWSTTRARSIHNKAGSSSDDWQFELRLVVELVRTTRTSEGEYERVENDEGREDVGRRLVHGR